MTTRTTSGGQLNGDDQTGSSVCVSCGDDQTGSSVCLVGMTKQAAVCVSCGDDQTGSSVCVLWG